MPGTVPDGQARSGPVLMPIALALFDVLEGRFGGDVPVASVPEASYRVHSIVGNLQRLLNTRQGSVPHLPDYGLPDLSATRREEAGVALRRAICDAVTAYEPRLSRVRVEPREEDPHRMRVTFVISGEIERGQRVLFETTFGSQELIDVREASR